MPSTNIDWAKIEAIWEKPEEGYTDCLGKWQVLEAERQDSPGGKPKGRVEGKGIGEKSKYADGFVHVEIKKVNIVSWISTTPDLVILATRHPMVNFSASPSTSVCHTPGLTSTPFVSSSTPNPHTKTHGSSSITNPHSKIPNPFSTPVAPSAGLGTYYPITSGSSSTGIALNPTRNTYTCAMTSSSPSTPIASSSPSSTFDISPRSTTSTPVASSTTSSSYTPYTMSPVDIVRAHRPGWLGPRLNERDVSSTYITSLAMSYVQGRSTRRG